MSPHIFYFLHQPGLNVVDGVVQDKVQEIGSEFLILGHGTVHVCKNISRLVEIIHELVINLLITLHWGFCNFIFNFTEFQGVNSFTSNIIDQILAILVEQLRTSSKSYYSTFLPMMLRTEHKSPRNA